MTVNNSELTHPDLILPLKRQYFEEIKAGTKSEEFRLDNEYWRKRLEGKHYSRIVLTLGYPSKSDDSRRIIKPWKGYSKRVISHPHFGSQPVSVFVINVE